MRTTLRIALAVALIASGWFAGQATLKITYANSGVFRIRIDAMSGAEVKCEGCRFISWPNGRAELVETVRLTCGGNGRCSQVIGAMPMPDGPKQMTQMASR